MPNLTTIDPKFKAKVVGLERCMQEMDSSFNMNSGDCPLEHAFGDGLYVRKIFMPAGTVIVSKLHKFTHPYFIMEGLCSVATEDGLILIEAPFYGMTQAGTKRALYIHEDTTWITVHRTEQTDLELIEKEIISPSYEDFIEYTETLRLKEE